MKPLLIELKNFNFRNELFSSFSYEYDAIGNITGVTDLVGRAVFTYDRLDQLKSSQDLALSKMTSFGYDLSGNRISVTEGALSKIFDHNAGNELVPSGIFSYSHDMAGNMLSLSENGIGKNFSWDALNRLTQVQQTAGGPPTTLANYTYDGLGRRVRKVNGAGQTTNYLFDGMSLNLLAETDGAGVIKKTYNPGISMTDDKGNKFFMLQDGRGNVATLIDKDGNIVQSNTYDAFGALLAGTDKSNGLRHVGQFGVYSDDDTGLQLMGARWYDPQLGRFISRDPIGFRGGLNLYEYARNNPLRYIDPLGLDAWDDFVDFTPESSGQADAVFS